MTYSDGLRRVHNYSTNYWKFWRTTQKRSATSSWNSQKTPNSGGGSWYLPVSRPMVLDGASPSSAKAWGRFRFSMEHVQISVVGCSGQLQVFFPCCSRKRRSKIRFPCSQVGHIYFDCGVFIDFFQTFQDFGDNLPVLAVAVRKLCQSY